MCGRVVFRPGEALRVPCPATPSLLTVTAWFDSTSNQRGRVGVTRRHYSCGVGGSNSARSNAINNVHLRSVTNMATASWLIVAFDTAGEVSFAGD